MNQTVPNSRTRDVKFAVQNRDKWQCQAYIGAQRQANVVGLRTLKAKLPALATDKLLQGTMTHIDQLGALRQKLLHVDYGQATGCPMLHFAVWVNRPKHLDQVIAVQMHRQAAAGNVQRTYCLSLLGFQVNLTRALQPRRPLPIVIRCILVRSSAWFSLPFSTA
jgi:hypothetical protein